jgi:predicted nucleic acid-binding protein
VIVVDASALAEALLCGGPAADRLADDDLHAPHLVDAEVASAVRGQLLGSVIEEHLAVAAIDTLARLELYRHPHVDLLPRAWELRANLTVFDALYVALAEALSVPLVTSDARLAQAPGIRTAVEVLPAGG